MDADITGVGRRKVLAVSAATVGGAALAACGSDDKKSPATETPNGTGGTNTSQPSSPSPSASTGGSTGTGTGAPAGKALAKTTDIPVGGGKIFADEKVVVTQPTAGTFKAFSATCTHQGCTVSTVSNGTIDCPCHGSKYSAADGSVKNGPATRALAEKKITTSGDQITLQ